MADDTKIEWADATVNYLNGCSVISAGCTNCYAMRAGGRNLPNHPSTGLTKPTKAGHVWTGETRANEKALLQPLAWKRPRRIFWNAHGDLFHESVPDAWIDRQFAVMALTPQHTHMVLTKRPERMRAYVANIYRGGFLRFAQIDLMLQHFDRVWPDPADFTLSGARGPIPNVWLGTSVEDQRAADERIPHLLATPAAVRFLSCEPLLGPVDLEPYLSDAWQAEEADWPKLGELDWVIGGGESGPGARPMHPDWARSLRDQCAVAGVAFHFKQWGEWGPSDHNNGLTPTHWLDRLGRLYGSDDPTAEGRGMVRPGKARTGRLLDGRTHDDFPGGAANG
ncbi:phage Gp37/Gp68 family protein [Sandarakinorhabdus sp.]|uniref:phage Gp37/Gp68 family protein n=1 Tax=Sandarakinorhabdus sp. TaxID=1916663 RepID=UPI00286DF824|nr:phage Gp37/Gp68 family protein [Sandarakinorhabdus sp.]